MATTRPFAFNTGSTISGTEQIGNLAIGVDNIDYSGNYGGVRWWMGPDEDLGYVIAQSVSSNTQPTQPGIIPPFGNVGFWRTNGFLDSSFIQLSEYVSSKSGFPQTFNTGAEAKTWLNDNGYWTSYIESPITPTPTPTITSTNTQTPTPTNTQTPTPTGVNQLIDPIIVGFDEYLGVGVDEYLMFVDPVTPGVSPTPTQTPTQTPTNTPTQTPTNTSTQTPTQTSTNTPTPTSTPTPIPVTGYGYNLVVLPYNPPSSGNTIFPSFNIGGTSGITNPNTFNVNGVYWNIIDNLGVDRTNYYSGMTGVSVTAYFTQNGETAIYSGSTTAFTLEGPPGQESFNYNPNTRPNQLTLIQSANTNFITGQTVYISFISN